MTVLIGVAVNGESVAGVIHQPYFNYQSTEPGIELGRTIWGIVGLGQSRLAFSFLILSSDTLDFTAGMVSGL